MLISDQQYWVFDGESFFAPQPLSSLGLPEYVDKLDDAFVWGKNGKTYFFYQNLYWRFNEATKTMDSGYPQDISRWNGVPRNIDAVLTSVFDGLTYFFKGEEFWTFDDYSLSTAPDSPRKINGFWTFTNLPADRLTYVPIK